MISQNGGEGIRVEERRVSTRPRCRHLLRAASIAGPDLERAGKTVWKFAGRQKPSSTQDACVRWTRYQEDVSVALPDQASVIRSAILRAPFADVFLEQFAVFRLHLVRAEQSIGRDPRGWASLTNVPGAHGGRSSGARCGCVIRVRLLARSETTPPRRRRPRWLARRAHQPVRDVRR
jgi:hypothetical protein